MDSQKFNQKGNPLMKTCTEQKPDYIVFEPKVSREDGDIFDVAAAGLQFEGRINQVSTDVLIELNILKNDQERRADVVNVSSLTDLIEQAHRIINRDLYYSLTLQPSYSGIIRKNNGQPIRVSIQENDTNFYSINL